MLADSCTADLRTRLLEELKISLKAKDSLASTAIRSVLSEVYSADKNSNGRKVDSSAIAAVIRKACARRLDSAAQFNQASRPNLAEKERQEADLLSRLLPPLLPEAEIDRILKDVITEQASMTQGHPDRSIGKVFKTFYSKVDRASVDPDLVKRRAKALTAA
ncbi:GatB/YqeY domain-containing protein [Russula earlei]|uniref:GatB/YqeY domain-containing protein n=1 Tax=Russula earlei TaxID=71964 RepID=A0ACC0U364_9AGAM|nr:GatB/YqeY domain-containing protein [Russula earlei]